MILKYYSYICIYKISKKIGIMGNIEISIDFNDFKPMTIGEDCFLIFDFKKAIDIIKDSKLPNVQLRQELISGVMEWDNF